VVYGTTNYADGDVVVFDNTAVAASPTVNLTASRSPASVTVAGSKNYTLTGSDIAGATGLEMKSSGTLTLNHLNTYDGNTVINAGTLRIGATGAIPDGAGKGDVTVASGATLDLNGVSEGINGLSGLGTLDNTGAAATLMVGLEDDGGTFAGTIQGAVSLAKQGTNDLTLTGTSSHTGATLVQQGSLTLNPLSTFSAYSALVVSNGATLNVSFTNAQGLYSFSALSLNGGHALTVDYGDASVTAYGTPITTYDALNLNGVSQIGILGDGFGVGSYILISYVGKTGTGSISATPAFLPAGMVATISDTGSAIVLNVTFPSIQTLVWTAGTGDWGTNGLFNWNFSSAEYKEYASGFGDAVRFENIDFGTVSLPNDVKPYSVTVDGPYVLSGPGGIAGATGLEKVGSTTTFTLDNTNTYAGLTLISQGTLQINNTKALGSTNGPTVVVPGGSLALSNGLTLTGELLRLSGDGVSGNNGALRSLDTNSIVTVSSPIALDANARIRAQDCELIVNGPLTDNGSNYMLTVHAAGATSVVRLNSASNVADRLRLYGFNLAGARIVFGADNTFPGSQLIAGGGTHDLEGSDQQFQGITDGSNTDTGVLTNSSALPSTLTITGTNEVATTIDIAGSVNVVKEGLGRQGLTGSNTYSGTTTVNEGTLRVGNSSAVTNAWTVNGGFLGGGGTTSTSVIGGPVTIGPAGGLHAGWAFNAIGNLTISNDLSLAGNVLVALNKDEPQSNDVINVTGTLSYGGTLTITNVGTNVLVAGDSFTVFPPGGVGSFSSIISDPNLTFLFNDGVLTVDSVTMPTVTLNYTRLGGGVLQFDWTGAYKLQWQTNALSTGLSTNWADYPDTSNPVNVTNDPAVPASFFRLQSQ
jgi:autotransporter-associated beta strand protein